jgi:uncharacterized membrane protein
LKDTILSSPEYPSLLSINDCLVKYKIETIAVKIDETKLSEIPLPSIVHIQKNGNDLFYVLKNIENEQISYYDHSNKLKSTGLKDFLALWTGVCLLVQKTTESKEPEIEKKRIKKIAINTMLVALAIFFVISIGFSLDNFLSLNTEESWILNSLFILLKLSGLAIGGVLLWYEVDKYNPTLQNFCSGGKKVNCQTVLDSKYANLFHGAVSLSAVAFGYFFSTFLLLLFTGFSYSSISLITLLSILTIPIILVSALTQAFVIKTWCKLCMIVQGVLVLELILLLTGLSSLAETNFYGHKLYI